MPLLAFRCPLCEKPFQVAAQHQGRAVACPNCGRAVAIPGSAGAAPAAVPAAQGLLQPTSLDVGAQDWPVESTANQRGLTEAEPSPLEPHRALQIREKTMRRVQLGGQVYEVRSLTPAERAAFRRRVNWGIFGVTAILMALAVVALLLWRG